jgi:uncharacterized protein YbjQ (UPF0145 family)
VLVWKNANIREISVRAKNAGANAMITIFNDFSQFFGEKMAFFLITNAINQFWLN